MSVALGLRDVSDSDFCILPLRLEGIRDCCLFFFFQEEDGICFFFFQAEDGIRDRSPSRGLGDVYKRQAQNSIELKKGEYHDYSVYLNATRYTVEPGHRLAVVVATEDPVNCLIHKTYSLEIDDNSVMVEVPVTKASEDMGLNKAE